VQRRVVAVRLSSKKRRASGRSGCSRPTAYMNTLVSTKIRTPPGRQLSRPR
jgi:hypothetical protein